MNYNNCITYISNICSSWILSDFEQKMLSDYRYRKRADKFVEDISNQVQIKKRYCIMFLKYKNFENPAILFIWNKKFILYSSCLCLKW